MVFLKDCASKLCSRVIPALIAGTLLIAGCGQGSGVGPVASSAPASPARPRLHGVIHGGQNPVVGATVTLYEAGYADYGTSYGVIGTGTTDSNGHYSIDTFTCDYYEDGEPSKGPSKQGAVRSKGLSAKQGLQSQAIAADIFSDGSLQTYIVATGGDAGSGPNSAIALMAAIGPCDQIQPSTVVNINELTTVAGEWALQQFSDDSGQMIGGPIENEYGLPNAYSSNYNLAETSPTDLSVSGNASSFLPTAAQCAGGSPPVNCDGLERLNSLADILAACVNSSGSSSTACQELFCYSTPSTPPATFSGGVCSVTPTNTDTLQAADSIAYYPNTNIAGLFSLATPNAPFEPTLAAAPEHWEIALNYSPAGAMFDDPTSLAFDSYGDLFVSNATNSVSQLTVTSGYTTAFNYNNNNTGSPGAVFNDPISIALDGDNDVFVANISSNSVSELTESSNYATGLNYGNSTGAAFSIPNSIALDPTGDLFVTNLLTSTVSELTQASGYSSGSHFAPSGAALNSPVGIVLDSSANLYVLNFDSVSELFSADMGMGPYGTGANYTGSPGAMLDDPDSIALDGQNNIFVANVSNSSVSELTAASTYATGMNFNNTTNPGAGFANPSFVVVDGDDNIFVANNDNSSVSELTAPSSGTPIGYNFAPAAAANSAPTQLAIDESGNIFLVGDSNSVSELIGLATPVYTPVEAESAGGAGRAGVAIIVFLTLLTFWYGRKYRHALTKRTA